MYSTGGRTGAFKIALECAAQYNVVDNNRRFVVNDVNLSISTT